MKESMWGYLIIGLGIVIIAILFLVQNLTTTNEQDYYLSREILKSAMYDAIDYGTYMKSGKLVMSKEKFVSVFTRRFAESVNPDRTYQLDFYDIYEYPPKATIRIKTNTGETVIKNNGADVEVNTFITGILETTEYNGEFNVIYSSTTGDMTGDGNFDADDLPLIEEYIDTHNGKCGNKKDAIDINNDNVCNATDLIKLKKILYGGTPLDINGDGELTKADEDIVVKCIEKGNCYTNGLTEKQRIIADVNEDGLINSSDKKAIYLAVHGGSSYDVNGDGKFTQADKNIVDKCISKDNCYNDGLTEQQRVIADVNEDGKINVADKRAMYIALHSETPYDVNGDGKLTKADEDIVAKCIEKGNCNTNGLNERQKVIADVTNDGKIDAKDKRIIYLALRSKVPHDVNEDGKLTEADIDTVWNCIANGNCYSGGLNEKQRVIADVNNDGVINSLDLRAITTALNNN